MLLHTPSNFQYQNSRVTTFESLEFFTYAWMYSSDLWTDLYRWKKEHSYLTHMWLRFMKICCCSPWQYIWDMNHQLDWLSAFVYYNEFKKNYIAYIEKLPWTMDQYIDTCGCECVIITTLFCEITYHVSVDSCICNCFSVAGHIITFCLRWSHYGYYFGNRCNYQN